MEWKVEVGHEVAEGDALVVIETDKASFDLESTASEKFWRCFGKRMMTSLFWRTLPPLEKRGKTLTTFVRWSGAFRVTRRGPEPFESHREPSLPATEATKPNHRISHCGIRAGISPRDRKVAMRHGIDPGNLGGKRSRRPSDRTRREAARLVASV